MEQKLIPKYLIDTDVLADHLIKEQSTESYFIKLMRSGICFTSVLNASELYHLADSQFELERVNDVLFSIKVLGIHARYSMLVPKYKNRFNSIRDLLFYILAESNKLTIVSFNAEKFDNLAIKSYHPEYLVP